MKGRQGGPIEGRRRDGVLQTIEVEAADEAGLRDHLAGWHGEQAGLAPGYLGARILAEEPRQAGT
jgi:hypothetical protein